MHDLSYSNIKNGKYEIYFRWNNYITSNWILYGKYLTESERDKEFRYLKIKYKDSPREFRKINNI